MYPICLLESKQVCVCVCACVCVCVCVFRKERGCTSLHPSLFNQPQSILTIIHYGPSQKSTSPVTHGLNLVTQKQGLLWGGVGGEGSCGALFVMLISWPNLNDPDICCPACVKPLHSICPPRYKKQVRPLRLVRMSVCVLVVDSVWVKGKKILLFQCMNWSNNYQEKRELRVCTCVQNHTHAFFSVCVCVCV